MVISILNFLNGSVHVMPITDDDAENVESYLWKIGFNPDNCQWLISQGLRLMVEL